MKRVIAIGVAVLIFLPLPLRAASRLELDTFVRVAEEGRPGVVNISTTKFGQSEESVHPPVPPGRPFPFGPPQGRSNKQRSLGSGFLIDRDGYILTNNHVISNVDEIIVRLSDDREYNASVVGTDPSTDLALIKIDPRKGESFNALALGESDKVKIGEWVVAIGNPFGLTHSVTVGVVGAKGRVLGESPYDSYIQTDASINPGNSGGPLLNARGEVVGVNTAIISSGSGIGFAVPINLAKKVVEQLKATGMVERGWLGITPQSINRDMAAALGLPSHLGVIVAQVVEGQPAHRGGLQVGDVITSFNGKRIEDLHDLFESVADAPVGSTVEVKVYRDARERTLKVVVGKRPEEKSAPQPQKKEESLGLKVTELSPENRASLGVTAGVVVDEVGAGSLADRADLRKGDVILKLNGREVLSPQDFLKELGERKGERAVVLYIRRGDRAQFVTLRRF